MVLLSHLLNRLNSMTYITKADGTTEEFDPEKLEQSLRRAGASDTLIESITSRIKDSLQEGHTTSEVYRKAFEYLKEGEHIPAARYAMRRAVLELGPTGFPFENFVGEIYKALGYDVEVGAMVRGACVEHEVDLVAKKDGSCIAAELKFHNEAGFKTDTKVALYVHARFLDLQKSKSCPVDTPLLITNTKFTSQAIEYSECVGLNLIGWSYPREGNLQDLIQQTKVYPVTVLTTLNSEEKRMLMEANAPLCSAIARDSSVLARAGIRTELIEAAHAESKALCGIQ